MEPTREHVAPIWLALSGASVGGIGGLMGGLFFWDEPTGFWLGICAVSGAILGTGLKVWGTRLAMAAGACVSLLVFVHVWFITLQALPAPGGGMNKRDWKSETVQGEFRAWTQRLNAMGVDIQQEKLEEHLWDLATGVMKVRREALRPMYPYYKNSGTWQSWRMFVAPHRYPSRLHMEIKEDGVWRTVYVARSTEYVWRAEQLDHDRFRAALFRYGWGKKYGRQWRGFGDWMAREAAVDFPNATELRLKFWSYRTLSPEEVREGVGEKGKWHRSRTISLEQSP